MLTYENICKSYGEEVILQGLTGEFEPGEMTAVLGDSGRGKSTLISILGLLLKPDSGMVMLDGQNLLDLADEEQARIRNRRFGFLFQHPQLIGSIRVKENVRVPLLLGGKDRELSGKGNGKGDGKVRGDGTEELLDQMGLSHRMDHYPFQLSIGQKRRVALARALIMDPDILFADEPTNDLDRANREIVMGKLMEMRDRGKTVIVVTHDEELAAAADRKIRL